MHVELVLSPLLAYSFCVAYSGIAIDAPIGILECHTFCQMYTYIHIHTYTHTNSHIERTGPNWRNSDINPSHCNALHGHRLSGSFSVSARVRHTKGKRERTFKLIHCVCTSFFSLRESSKWEKQQSVGVHAILWMKSTVFFFLLLRFLRFSLTLS